jgi:hypothetical protein
MAYYPKNRIQLNLYTNGDEYVYKASNTSYRGYYYKLYNGTFFTGKTPNDGDSQEIILATETPEVQVLSQPDKYLTKALDSTYDAVLYEELTSEVDFPKKVPYPQYPVPTAQDYKIGEFQRYFVKKVNVSVYMEVSQDTYNNVFNRSSNWDWQLYSPISIPWQITGLKDEVISVNSKIVALYERQNRIFGFGLFIEKTGGYLKYYK